MLVYCACLLGIASAADEAAAPAQTAAAVATKDNAEPPKLGRPTGPHRKDTIYVFNRPIVTFRAPFLGIQPAERAAAAHDRIVGLLERGGPGAVTVESLEPGDAIKIDGRLAFVLTKEDLDPLSGETFEGLIENSVHALERTIAETHEARSARLMFIASMKAGAATVVLILLLWVLSRIGRFVTRRMIALAEAAAGQIKVGGTEILQRERAINLVRRLLQIGFWIFVLLLFYEWLGFVLASFPYTRPWGEELNAFMVDTSVNVLTSVALALPDLLIALAIFFLARGINRLLANFFDGVQSGRVQVDWLDPDSARPTRRLAAFGVWVFAIVMAYPYIPGSGSEAFKGLSVLLGLMVSLGASGIVGQAASGLILMYTRTFRPGEYVRIGDNEGTVVEMGMFTTRVRTGLGEELTVPNSMVLASVTRNYSRAVKGTGYVVDTTVTIGYDAPWREVHAMLIEAARRTTGVLASPAPRVFQTGLSDFYPEYRLVCQAIPSEPRPRAEVLSSLHANIQDVFNEHGVQIMSPHYVFDPRHVKVVAMPEGGWPTPPDEK